MTRSQLTIEWDQTKKLMLSDLDSGETFSANGDLWMRVNSNIRIQIPTPAGLYPVVNLKTGVLSFSTNHPVKRVNVKATVELV